MIIGLTMILANAGIQIFNSWQNNRQNSLLQAKREEFELAARENNKERMFQIMREGHELTLQLEKENHQNRLKDLHTDFDRLLQKLAYTAAMNQWPLNVLPIVMKNQASGNMLAKQEEHIALHCIFTPSNCKEFNRHVFPVVESALENFCGEHYSTISGHPVLFYSGAWKTNDCPTEIQIDSMQSALGNLPTLLITPLFRPTDHKLVMKVRLWGVGKKTDEFFSIPEIENDNFQRVYSEKGDYIGDEDLKNDIIEDLVPSIECIIGCMSDIYFLSVLNIEPVLPSLINQKFVNTDGMKYLVHDVQDFYVSLLNEGEEKFKLNLFTGCAAIKIFSSLYPTWSDDERKKRTEQLLLNYCNSRLAVPSDNIDDAVKKSLWFLEDYDFIDKITGYIKQNGEEDKYRALYEIKDILDTINYKYSVFKIKNINELEQMAADNNAVAMYRLGEIYEYGIGVDPNQSMADKYYQKSSDEKFFLAEIRMGKITFDSLGEETVRILRNMQLMQIDIEYARSVLNGNDDEEITQVVKQMSATFMASQDKYSHSGFVYYLGYLMMKQKKDLKNAMALLQLAGKMGNIKAREIINF